MTDTTAEHYERVADRYNEHWTYDPDYVRRFAYDLDLELEDEFGNRSSLRTSLQDPVAVLISPRKRNWWRAEEPTPAEMAEGAKRLDEAGLRVDYIITHEPPSLVKSAILLRRGDARRR